MPYKTQCNKGLYIASKNENLVPIQKWGKGKEESGTSNV